MNIKRILSAAILLIILGTSSCWAEEANAWVINHAMAGKIEYVQGKGFFVNGPTHIKFINPAGSVPAVTKFATLDQLVFMSGTYKIDLKIVDDATGTILSEASHKSVTLKDDRSIQSFVTEWSVTAKSGLYTYQVLVNNTVAAAFKIVIDEAK